MPMHTAIPTGLTDARHIIANPEAYANRPSLVALARIVAASALGRVIPQRRRDGARGAAALPPEARPALRVIEGGKGREDHTGPVAA